MDTESHPQCLKRLLSCVESRSDGYIPTTTDPVRAVHSQNLWTTDQKLITTGCKVEGQDENKYIAFILEPIYGGSIAVLRYDRNLTLKQHSSIMGLVHVN